MEEVAMKVYTLLSRIIYHDTVKAILKPDDAEFAIRFVENEKSKPVNMLFKVQGLICLSRSGIHGLLGRGTGDFASQWFFIPGTSEIAYYISTVVVTIPFKADQPFGQLKLELEAAVMKALEPTPA